MLQSKILFVEKNIEIIFHFFPATQLDKIY